MCNWMLAPVSISKPERLATSNGLDYDIASGLNDSNDVVFCKANRGFLTHCDANRSHHIVGCLAIVLAAIKRQGLASSISQSAHLPMTALVFSSPKNSCRTMARLSP